MSVYMYSLVSVIVVSLVSFIGIFTLSLRTDILKKYVFLLVSLAVGALLGDAFIHLLPEAFEKIANPTNISILIIAGIFIFFILEKVLHWHHHNSECDTPHPVGRLILFSDGMHNFVDGLIIGTSYLVSIELGLATTIAVILHEIPQEIGDFGVLIHAGYTKARALWWNFVSALFAIIGVLGAFLLGQFGSMFAVWFVPFAAGGFIYVALSDLIPELQKTKSAKYSLLQLVFIAIGIGAMLLLLRLES